MSQQQRGWPRFCYATLFATAFGLPYALAPAQAQLPDGATLQFEVASVKPSPSDGGVYSLSVDAGGRLTAKNAAVKRLIGFAYGLTENEIVGGPRWIDSTLFDVIGKPEGPPILARDTGAFLRAGGPYRLMLASLLVERFQLKAHKDVRALPSYSLVIGRKGFAFHEASKTGSIRIGPGGLSGPMTLDAVAQVLTRQLGRTVHKRTNLTALYDVVLNMNLSAHRLRKASMERPRPYLRRISRLFLRRSKHRLA